MSIPDIFSSHPNRQIGSLGETAILQQIRERLAECIPSGLEGPFDDAALLPREESDGLITVDPVVFGMHFDQSMRPREVGRKLVNRNISDIAAMGGTPTRAVLSLILPSNASVEWLDEFLRGMVAAALEGKVLIVGGDLSASHKDWIASLTLLGKATSRAIPRHGVQPNDLLWVTGKLGGSLHSGHHLNFSPRVAEGKWLACQPTVRTMMDISDGLGKDLPAMLETFSAYLDETQIPISPAARELEKKSGKSALHHAFNDGEDYELLFSTEGNLDIEEFTREWQKIFSTPISNIGKVLPGNESNQSKPFIFRQKIESSDWKGYEHLC
ncbi:MAG: thiamine-monophosphate kinase [Opitutales bacterium]|nr:thiamine-monophosphate kinase [Opitutales bacterium]MCH8539531.1 thiamine-phosphate kinase [Opitutales bacterium]